MQAAATNPGVLLAGSARSVDREKSPFLLRSLSAATARNFRAVLLRGTVLPNPEPCLWP